MTREELERYNALMEVGAWLEAQGRYDYAAVLQAEVDRLIQPAVERLKAKSRERDRMTQEFLEQRRRAEWEAQMKQLEEEEKREEEEKAEREKEEQGKEKEEREE